MATFRLLQLSLSALGVMTSLYAPTTSAQSWYSDSTTYAESMTCTTRSASTGVTPLPTDYARFSETSYFSEPVVTDDTTVYVTANTTTAYPVTSWSYVTLRPTITLDKTTTTKYLTATPTIATLTSTTVVCTNGVTPTSTVTVYRGHYSAIPGQNTTLPAAFPTAVACTVTFTALIHVWPTVQGSGTVTSTVTPSSAGAVTSTTITETWPTTVYRSTVLVTFGNYAVATSVATVSKACKPKPTVTYEARCAPSNLIAEMDGQGLDVVTFNPRFTFGGWADMSAGDPSKCCQLCADNRGCVASVYWAQSNACLLGYVGGDERCPEAFTYHAPSYWEPRLAQIYQVGSGCGTIRYVPGG
ncbi:hypothetical protein B0T22DRAFT_461184 [Podospora appendiculata]|uniref:Apple domain-containing protein n=1 Tax=Podospora appendiculata TaxID=314037 RepID=A0AAE0XAU9_9PEZI|nr:hypothetical protein B0T22DRAFT_461184 [Podospora appendiculata]